MRTSTAIVLAAMFLLATPALAADRAPRDSRDGSAPAPAPVVVPTPVPTPAAPGINYSTSNHGSISSNTGVNTSSGNNQGGSVTTGDQSNTVTVVNVGPTSNNTQVGNTPPAPQQVPQCSGRDCPRNR